MRTLTYETYLDKVWGCFLGKCIGGTAGGPAEGRKELFDTEWDVPIDKPIIFHDSEVVPVSGEDIEKLEGLADFKEG